MPVPLSASSTWKSFPAELLLSQCSAAPAVHRTCIAESQDSALFSLDLHDISGTQMAALPTSVWSAFPDLTIQPPVCWWLQTWWGYVLSPCPGHSQALTILTSGTSSGAQPVTEHQLDFVPLITNLGAWWSNCFCHPVASFSNPISHWLPRKILWDTLW